VTHRRGGSASRFLAYTSSLLLSVALLSLSAPAAAQEQSLGTHQKHLRLEAGVRAQFIDSEGLDPFAENDVVAQFTTGASYTLLTSDRLSVAGSFLVDLGGKGSKARGSEAYLGLYRFALGPELRYHVLRVAAATLRVSPTLAHTQAELSDSGAGLLVKNAWTFGVDATAGAAVEVYGFADGQSRKPRVWLVAEGGYGWSATSDLTLVPEDAGSAPLRLSAVNLGELSLSGPLFRITAAISF